MLSDITLGQYYPSESAIHKMDASVKIMLTLLYMILVFLVKGFMGYAVITLFLAVVLSVSKIPFRFMFKGLKPVLIFLVFTFILNIFLTDGRKAFTFIVWDVSYEGIYSSLFMVSRIILLVAGSTFLTYTTTPIMLTDGIEKLLKPFARIGVPAYELAMMMSIALRFIPTLIEETDKIMKAQKARGADFESGGLIRRAKALIPILVPLFISAFRRADDLAVAMESRCYNGGEKRTRLNETKPSFTDFKAVCIFILFFAGAFLPDFLGFEITGF